MNSGDPIEHRTDSAVGLADISPGADAGFESKENISKKATRHYVALARVAAAFFGASGPTDPDSTIPYDQSPEAEGVRTDR